MTISQDLVDRYTDQVDVDWFEALIISHSQFQGSGVYYCHNAATLDSISCNTPDGYQNFLAVPFELSLPERDTEGRGDLLVSFSFPQTLIVEYLADALTNPLEPIVLQYTCYLFSDTAVMLYDPPLQFSLTDIAVTEEAISATCRNSDMINKRFPEGIYQGSAFPGLIRR